MQGILEEGEIKDPGDIFGRTIVMVFMEEPKVNMTEVRKPANARGRAKASCV